ncbi:MAG: hypothetical protein NC409_13285 [Clostridium sp.]|nr:hypothetical protein [Clostridium sp.]
MTKKTHTFQKTTYLAASCCMLCLMAACGSDTEKQPENRESMIEEVANLPDAEIKIPATLIGDELADIPIISADGSSPDAPETEAVGGADPAQSQDASAVGGAAPAQSGDASADDGAAPAQSGDASADGGADSAQSQNASADNGANPAQSQNGSADGGPAASDSDSATDDPDRGSTENSSVQNVVPEGQYGQMDEDNNVTYHLDGDTRTRLLNDLARNIQDSIEAVLSDKYYYPNITDIRVNSDCTEFTIYLSADKPNLYESSLMLSFYTVGDQYQIYNGIPMEDAKTTVIYVHADTGAELARTDSTSVQ